MKNKLVRVTREEEFEAAHLLPGYDGGCKNLHGHSYKIKVTVEGPQNKGWGMVLDFKNLKNIIKGIVPDHKFLANKNDELSMRIVSLLKDNNLDYVLFDFDTTAENMVGYFAAKIQDELDQLYDDVKVVKIRLWETTNSEATWEA